MGLGVCYSNLGTTYEMLGKHDYAAEKHEKVKNKKKELPINHSLVFIIINFILQSLSV